MHSSALQMQSDAITCSRPKMATRCNQMQSDAITCSRPRMATKAKSTTVAEMPPPPESGTRGNQGQSMQLDATGGDCRLLRIIEVIRGNQRQSEVVRGNQRHSEALRGD